ncbi:MAG: adenylyl-sulfate kinase, partial [Candidatus Thiodiazotropha sp. (ex Semelilucina semeliformis)]|nr:adenylyl-sulfate kinase [Candidatus Thiodiazotropha sp. (ex Semelilucina semeliformis)]
FIEVFVDAPLTVCQERDPKGLYAKAVRGEIKQFTGIDSPYEIPEKPEVHIRAGEVSVAEAVNQLLSYLHEIGALQAGYEPVALEA